MKRIARVAFAVCLAAGIAGFAGKTFAQDGADAAGPIGPGILVPSYWENQGGSTMMLLMFTGTPSVTGYYVNNEAGFGCQGTPYLLNGWVWGDFISFSVAWDNASANCNSVTNWTGYLTLGPGGQAQLQTDWNLAQTSGGSPQIVSGSDTFTLIDKVERPAALE